MGNSNWRIYYRRYETYPVLLDRTAEGIRTRPGGVIGTQAPGIGPFNGIAKPYLRLAGWTDP